MRVIRTRLGGLRWLLASIPKAHQIPDRETILLVSHEASRTGAPILTLNLVQALVERYNVVVLLLGGGPLCNDFRRAGATVMVAAYMRSAPPLASMTVARLCKSFKFRFALVNSIESRVVLPALNRHSVPTVCLIHEFAAYTRPRHAFREAFFWSDEIAFSTTVTSENAFSEYPELRGRAVHILPQGRCVVPKGMDDEKLRAESARIHRSMRPAGIAENSVIVLGAGSVQLRKGVDLFIECASLVTRSPGGDRCRFVWIGQGYDPENDVGYSAYLADQIRRAGLERHVFFVDETEAIEAAYAEADLFLLSSRLDPLPNVAIDALTAGVPVLCFNKTTGIADFLIESGLGESCVADYLDSTDLAEKILVLAGSEVLRSEVAGRCREASAAFFDMNGYVASLETLGQKAFERKEQEKADVQEILASGLFRQDFSCPPHLRGQSIEEVVRSYVRSWASGVGCRKPLPGFHPGMYLEQHGLATQGADPFADYLRSGRPDGPWNYPVIVAEEKGANDLPANHRIALHLHVYYPELLAEIIGRLSKNQIRPDLFVSIADENVRELVESELKSYEGRVVDIECVPNRGRDIGPLFSLFGPKLMNDYDYLGHIHTKKSADLSDGTVGKVWFDFLLNNLLGDKSFQMADYVLEKMKNDVSIGMVFPDDPYAVGWIFNRQFADDLAKRIGLTALPNYFNFPVGTMFWARTKALLPLMSLRFGWDDYPEEPLPYDGSVLHAIERLLPLSLAVSNYRIATINMPGVTR